MRLWPRIGVISKRTCRGREESLSCALGQNYVALLGRNALKEPMSVFTCVYLEPKCPSFL